ncbi:MAG TPA: nuclear transport factor 2 family protein [Steroidobacteraceae bacterium]|nr:nuclear transport factor 2 family protein [Steroidobacteraceae bacterium]
MKRISSGGAPLLLGLLLIPSVLMSVSQAAKASAGQNRGGPTKESALAAETELAQALRTNDADGFCRLLDPDWAVVDGNGGINRREGVCAAIKAGTFTRTTYEPDLAHARVRVYGNTATITFHLSLSGPFKHKTFSGKEVETDVLLWEGGGWKCVLTHETDVLGTLVIK